MESTQPTKFYTFHFKKQIRIWKEFLATLKRVLFTEDLNRLTDQQIQNFWKKQLCILSKQTQKICILLPIEVKAEPKKQKKFKTEQLDDNSFETKQKLKLKLKKQSNETKILLDQRVLNIAKEMVEKQFHQLSYDYSSLYLGNPKQLLIFRKCYAIESYIQKYRLPDTFKEPFALLESLNDQYYYVKIQRNYAISTHNQQSIMKKTEKIKSILSDIDCAFKSFSSLWKTILFDFISKQKCKEIILKNVGNQLIQLLRPLCIQLGTDIINRYAQYELIEYKDILILKKEDPRLLPQQTLQIYDYQPKKYLYIEPQHVLQPPLDIKYLQFVKIDLVKHCFTYRFYPPNSKTYAKPDGIFIRSEPGNQNYELTVLIRQNCQQIEIDIYPYQKQKLVYQVYTWNNAGFTKSTEEIVLYNVFEDQNGRPFKNHNIYLFGQSQTGLKYIQDIDNIQQDLIKFKIHGRHQAAASISIGTGALICDTRGDVAGWGTMYFPENNSNQEEHNLQNCQDNYRIQTPTVFLAEKVIRKVSCGNSYSLLLSIFGTIYSMGLNNSGQLGLGHLNSGPMTTDPQLICSLSSCSSPFIIDIYASCCSASFAINSNRQLYRWGRNQVQQTHLPIYDRFDSIMNYSSAIFTYKNANPQKVNKNYLRDSIMEVVSGNCFYFALDIHGNLYGWGLCKYLGIKQLRDKQQRVVLDIVNPLQLMSGIKTITAGYEHAIVVTQKGQILGWGEVPSFSQKHIQFAQLPIDLTDQYGQIQQISMIRAGSEYTVILTKKNELKIMGKRCPFAKNYYQLDFTPIDISCGYQYLLGILGD